MRWMMLTGMGMLLALGATAGPPEGRRGGGFEDGERPRRANVERQRGGQAEAGDRQRQRGNRGERGGERGERPPHPIMVALDTDKDGQLSSSEIDGAVAALKQLDRNNDGSLDRRELRPPRRGGAGAADAGVDRKRDKRQGRGDRNRGGDE